MSVKKFEEYCENCGCPLDICCKPKQPVVSLQELKEEFVNLKDWINEIVENKDAYLEGKLNSEDTMNFFEKIENFKEEINDAEKRLLSWAENQGGEKKK